MKPSDASSAAVTPLKAPRVLERRFDFAELPEGLCRLQVYSGFMETPDVPPSIARFFTSSRRWPLTFFSPWQATQCCVRIG